MIVQSARGAITDLPVRRLGLADLPAIVVLAGDRGWSPEENKWRLIFAVSEVYGVDDPAGGLAGTVVLTRYGNGLAAIGMMLVASRHGRRGLGRRLMRHVLEAADGAVVYLTATEQGRPLYEQLGFQAVDTSTTYIGIFDASQPVGAAQRVASASPRPVTAAGLGALAELDVSVFGANRRRVLAELVTFADRFVECGEPVSGYAAAWINGDIAMIGPLVASDVATAAILISSLATGRTGPIRLDVTGRHSDLARWAVAHGLSARGATTLMVHGGSLPGDRARLFGPVSVALG
ncbi:MAG TPA: GNAT family N-acetyltransferase [Streptosporangiaceae bacterium]|nr:GNAT family N-acetyltransferase [Streptosporangiaceae bacterium]